MTGFGTTVTRFLKRKAHASQLESGIYFAAETIPGRNGIAKGALFPDQDKRWIRAYLGGDPGVPFHELRGVQVLAVPYRQLADDILNRKLTFDQAKAFLAAAEARADG